MKNNLVVKKNDFLKFGYSLPMTEQRLLLACISQVDSRATLDVDHKLVVHVQEMRDLFSDESKNLYRDLKSACETLWDREIVRVDVEGTEKIRWVRKVKYFKKGSRYFCERFFRASCSKNQQKLRDHQCLRLPRFVLVTSFRPNKGSKHRFQMT